MKSHYALSPYKGQRRNRRAHAGQLLSMPKGYPMPELVVTGLTLDKNIGIPPWWPNVSHRFNRP